VDSYSKANSKESSSGEELSSKEKERLVFNYLRAHRNEFMSGGEDSGELKHAASPTTEAENEEERNGKHHRPANMYQHEKESKLGKGQMYDDRMTSNSEGKLHRSDEEQVLADGKPLRQAGGSHELPFALMSKSQDEEEESAHLGGVGHHHSTDDDESGHGREHHDDSSDDDKESALQNRHRKHHEDDFVDKDDGATLSENWQHKTREEKNEERYHDLLVENPEDLNDRSKGKSKGKGGSNGEVFVSKGSAKEQDEDKEDGPKYKHYKGFKFRYGPTESFTGTPFMNNDERNRKKKPKKSKKIFPDNTDSSLAPEKLKGTSEGGADFNPNNHSGGGSSSGSNSDSGDSSNKEDRERPSEENTMNFKTSENEDGQEEGTAPSPFEPDEKMSYHPTKLPTPQRKYHDNDDNGEADRVSSRKRYHEDEDIRVRPQGEHSQYAEEHERGSNREWFEEPTDTPSHSSHHRVKGVADSHATFRIHTKKETVELMSARKKSGANYRYSEDEEKGDDESKSKEGGEKSGGETVDKIKDSDERKDRDVKLHKEDDESKEDFSEKQRGDVQHQGAEEEGEALLFKHLKGHELMNEEHRKKKVDEGKENDDNREKTKKEEFQENESEERRPTKSMKTVDEDTKQGDGTDKEYSDHKHLSSNVDKDADGSKLHKEKEDRHGEKYESGGGKSSTKDSESSSEEFASTLKEKPKEDSFSEDEFVGKQQQVLRIIKEDDDRAARKPPQMFTGSAQNLMEEHSGLSKQNHKGTTTQTIGAFQRDSTPSIRDHEIEAVGEETRLTDETEVSDHHFGGSSNPYVNDAQPTSSLFSKKSESPTSAASASKRSSEALIEDNSQRAAHEIDWKGARSGTTGNIDMK